MLNSKIAFETAQKVNRANWLTAMGDKLSLKIIETAKTGKRELVYKTDDLIKGAEDLYEAGEMLSYMYNMLEEAGYNHIIKPDGTLIISW